tara:strand:+ start:441 stop:770 length:330 start_codon:yes stop_codon:yes gene_type:complete
MAVGFQLRNASSGTVFTLDDSTLLQVDFFEVLAGQSVTKSFSFLPSGATLSTAIVFVNQPPQNEQFVLPTVSISGTTLTATGINSSGSTTVSGTYTIQSGTVYVLVFAK